ncbi:MAG: lipase family protein [Peptococcaceae bacterium]|nr:lipase family protein [Peptococcaceae bacterium]
MEKTSRTKLLKNILIMTTLLLLLSLLPLAYNIIGTQPDSDYPPTPQTFTAHIGAESIIYSDNDFAAPSHLYNENISAMLVALSAAAYSQDAIVASLNNLGFDPQSILTDYSSSAKTDNKVGFAIAHKKINAAEKPYDLISVNIRGTAGNEWYSNFNIGSGDDHAGFKAAEEALYKTLQAYINEQSLTNKTKTKIIVTGHSRGAAVANLLAADLTQKLDFADKDNIFAYTFATPNTSKSAAAKDPQAYNNIFNLINSEDIIPYLPLAGGDWGYSKYGVTLMFPAQGYNPGNFSNDVQDALKTFIRIAPQVQDFYDKSHETGRSSLTLEAYFNLVCDVASGSSLTSSLTLIGLMSNETFGPISRFLLLETDNTFPSHDTASYIALTQSTPYNDFLRQHTVKHVSITSTAVNIDIYDSQGNLVGRTLNGVVDPSIKSHVGVFINGAVKNIYMPVPDTYKIVVTGILTSLVNNKMTYTAETIDMVFAKTTAQKHFTGITLTPGKKIQSELAEIPNTKLFTVKDGVPVAEIAPDGTETQLTIDN